MVAARSTRTGTRRGKNSGGDGTPSTTTSVTTTTAARVRKRSRDVTIGVHVPPPPPTSSRRHRPSVDIPTPRGSPLVDGQALTMQGAGDGAGDDATSAASSMDVVENVCTPPLSTRNGDTADADMDPDASFASTTSTTTAIAESETRELLGQVQGENETETRELLGQVEGEDVMVSINDKRERRRRASIMHEDTADGFDEDVVDDAESEALRTPIMSKADLMEDIVMANVVNTEDGLLPEKEASTAKKTVVAATEETAEALARRTSASLALVEIQGYFNELVDALLAQRDRDLNAERDAILNGTSSPYLDALTTITTAHEHALSTASRRRDIAHASIKAELSARHQQLQQEFIGRRAALRRLLLSGLARVKAEVGDARRMEETWRVERLLTVRPGLDVPELPPPPAPMKQRRRNWMAMAPTFDPWSAPEAQRQSSQSPPAALPSPTPIFRSDMQHRENLHVTHEYASTMDENATHVPPRLVAHGLHDAEIEEDLAMLRGMASMCEMEVVAKEENQEETLPPATRCGTVADVAAVAVAALEVDDNTTPTTTSSA